MLVAFRQAMHLVRRFFGSARPGAPHASDVAWAEALMVDGERQLFARMSNPDQRHSIDVARAVAAELPGAERPVMAAALLHDVGKVQSQLRTPARVVATVWWAVVDDERADQWSGSGGMRGRFGDYRRHPEIGEELLLAAGSDPLTASWAADHHKPERRWRIDPAIGDVLKRCDDD